MCFFPLLPTHATEKERIVQAIRELANRLVYVCVGGGVEGAFHAWLEMKVFYVLTSSHSHYAEGMQASAK